MIDLHTHSTRSDGSDAPSAIPELAAAAGCTAVALTDHDRLDGIEEAAASAARVGVELVPGCEISCEHPGTMHVLVYFLQPGDGPLQTELLRLQQARIDRNVKMAVRLREECGIDITYEEMVDEARSDAVGRPHVARILVRKGYVSTIQEAFDVYLAKGQPGYLDKERLEADVAIRLARESGGVPVLAHPLSLKLEPADLSSLVRELAGYGLGGIEAIYGRYSPEEREAMRRLAVENGLVVTGGSDHHGTYKPDLQVGVGRGDLDVPDSLLDDLKERIPA